MHTLNCTTHISRQESTFMSYEYEYPPRATGVGNKDEDAHH